MLHLAECKVYVLRHPGPLPEILKGGVGWGGNPSLCVIPHCVTSVPPLNRRVIWPLLLCATSWFVSGIDLVTLSFISDAWLNCRFVRLSVLWPTRAFTHLVRSHTRIDASVLTLYDQHTLVYWIINLHSLLINLTHKRSYRSTTRLYLQ